ncbi:MAG TPA: DUF3857 domain-containing protein [Anaeromyxobacter sp.]|nr:DUF3857 domain-containing protein [Anaeromyxobacter sp.]
MSSDRRPLLLFLAALLWACAGPGRAGRPAGAAAPPAPLAEAGDPALPAAAPLGPGDPFGALGQALRARRVLDGDGEVEALLVAAQNDGPAAAVALHRLAELVDESPARAAQVDSAVARLLSGGKLTGLAAYRARVTRAIASEALGDHAAAAARRGENGAVNAFTLAGPFSELRVLDFDRTIPPEAGVLPAEVEAPAGLPPYRTRAIPAPDGTFALEGEPPTGDVFALASDATLMRGGLYLLTLTTAASVRLLVDGALVHERRAFAAWLPGIVHVPLELSPGRHRLLVKLSRSDGSGALSVSLSRADGTPSDATWAAPDPLSPPPQAPRPVVAPPVFTARALAEELVRGAGPVLGRLWAARDALSGDRESAKAILAEALALAPGSASLEVLTAEAREGDPTLDRQVGQERAEAALREALRADPGQAEARVRLGWLLRATDRFDDAEEVLSALSGPAASRPRALLARARVAEGRGLYERAEALGAEALAAGGGCDAADLTLSLALRRQALSRIEEATALLGHCRGGDERLARYRRGRGDAAGAGAALGPLLAARPWDVEAALARAEISVSEGEPRAAAERVAALAEIWPRNPRIQNALAGALELAGDAAGARAARERALLLDGGDLTLRRALALEDGHEALDDLSFDARAAIRAYEAAGRRTGTSSVMVLDAASVDIHPGGVATERTQQVIHVLDQAGVDQHGEISLPAGAEIIAARTLKPDGRVLEPERGNEEKGTLSLAGLEPGDYLEIDYIRAVRAPFGALGYAADPFYFQAPRERLFRSTYVVRAPAGAGLSVDAHGMPAPEVVREGGSEVMRAERRDVPPFFPEPDAPGMGEYVAHLAVGTGAAREAFQRNIADRLVGRTKPTQELLEFVRQIRAEARDGTPLGLVRAAYARVARTVLGEGPLLEDASQVLSRGRGSRLLVLEAVLEALGFEARMALVKPFAADPAPHRFPTPSLYAAQVLRVRAGNDVVWLDPSVRQNPFGALPPWIAGCEALIVPAPGEAPTLDRTPENDESAGGRESELRLVLAPDGAAELSGSDRYLGALGAALKGQIESLDSSQRRQAVEALLARSFRGMNLEKVAFEGEDDPQAPLVIRWRGRAAQVARPVEGGLLLEASPQPAQLRARYVRLSARTTPLLIQEPERATSRLQIVPPAGMRVVPGAPARLDAFCGSYERTDRATDGDFVRQERLRIDRARLSPERYQEFSGFAAAVDGLEEEPLLITR